MTGRDSSAELRRRAEAALERGARSAPTPPPPVAPGEGLRLRHELDVNSVELELQSEELRRSQAELQAACDRYAALYEDAPVGYLTLDPVGTILEVNARVVALLGKTRAELVGTPLSRHVPRDHAAALGDHLRAVVAGDVACVCELAFDGPLGARRYGRVESVAVGADGGSVRMVVVDITAQHEAQDARRDAERALQRREEELLHLQRLEVLGHLAARLAHEYRNIFGAMRWSVAAARQAARVCVSEDCPTTPHFERLAADVERANALATQVVALGRKQRATLQPTELDVVLGQMEEVLRSLLGGRGVEVEVERAAPGAWVLAGQGWVEQVILNLAMNARDAMPAGGLLRLTTRLVLEGVPGRGPVTPPPRSDEGDVEDAGSSSSEDPPSTGEAVALSVTDSGAGMFPETIARLFEPFFTTKKGQAGSGLGLSTVRDLVERMRGHIGVQSAPGQGSTFTVTLPRSPARAPSGRVALARLPALPPRPLTVLVVDDEPLILRTVEHYLRVAGHRPLVASGARAMRTCLDEHAGAIDLLITDVCLPDATARELAKLVQERHPDIRVLHMSALPRAALLDERRIEPSSVTIEKPFTEEGLARAIAEVLGP